MIKCVVFDIDNTIYDYDICHEKAMRVLMDFACRKYFLSHDDFIRAFNTAKDSVKKNLGNVGASHNRMLYMQRFLEQIGQNPILGAIEMYDVYWNTMLSEMTLFPYVMPLIKELQKREVKIAVLTDLTAHIQHRKIIRLGLADKIEFLVTSEEAGEEKPSPKMFGMLLEKTGLLPSEILMIGDSPKKDINGALEMGMCGILFTKAFHADMRLKCLRYIDEKLV